MSRSPLLPHRRPVPDARAHLVCLPIAGGVAAMYREWADLLPTIDVCAVELPGHGMRMREPPLTEMAALVDHLADALQPLLDRPVALFGHSLGARVAFALARRMPRVVGLIASAAHAAHLPPRSQRSALPRPALIHELRLIGGTPQPVLDDDDIMDLFLPTIRADFGILERGLAAPDARIACPLLVLAARDDREVVFERVAQWPELTTGPSRLVELTGGHMYVQTRRDAVLSEIRAAIAAWS